MSKLGKWETERNHGALRNVLFTARNKDNKDLDGFTERRKAFVTTRTDDELQAEFEFFKDQGLEGETSRLYVSVNERDNEKVRNNFMKWLLDQTLDGTDVSMASTPSRVAMVAAKSECAKEKKWLLDYDDDVERIDEFVQDVFEAYQETLDQTNAKRVNRGKKPLEADFYVEKHKTPNGYGVVTSSGFDTRKLAEKWGSNLVKRDDLYCTMWGQTGQEVVKGSVEKVVYAQTLTVEDLAELENLTKQVELTQ